MLALPSAPSARPITPNLLPASIKHSGPVPTTARYWAPEADDHERRNDNDERHTQRDGEGVKTDDGDGGDGRSSARRDPDTPSATTTTARSTSKSESSTATAYFRGRKLRGRRVRLPSAYQGLVLAKTGKKVFQKPTAEQLRRMDEDGMMDEAGDLELWEEKYTDVTEMEESGGFDEIIVWGHEAVPDDEDVHVKGVEEWIRFAEAIHTGS